jgi:hypothetical protein
MTTHQETVQVPNREALVGYPAPISLETIAVIQQVFAEVVRGLRERAAATQHAAAAEYDSWSAPRH